MSCSGNGVKPARGDKPHGRRPKPGVTPKAGNTTTVPPSHPLSPHVRTLLQLPRSSLAVGISSRSLSTGRRTKACSRSATIVLRSALASPSSMRPVDLRRLSRCHRDVFPQPGAAGSPHRRSRALPRCPTLRTPDSHRRRGEQECDSHCDLHVGGGRSTSCLTARLGGSPTPCDGAAGGDRRAMVIRGDEGVEQAAHRLELTGRNGLFKVLIRETSVRLNRETE